jgi:hypothetical protein
VPRPPIEALTSGRILASDFPHRRRDVEGVLLGVRVAEQDGARLGEEALDDGQVERAIVDSPLAALVDEGKA